MPSLDRPRLIRLAQATAELKRRQVKRSCEESLAGFVRHAWPIIEPGQEYVHGWHIDVVAEHLEAISVGTIIDGGPYNRLLINIPPGMMKSLLCNVFWPAWEWGPHNKPHLRYVCASHSLDLALRDSVKMRRLISSDWYQRLWGDRVKLTGDQNAKGKFENTSMGFRQAVAAGSITGVRGDRVIIDDPHSVESAASEQMRQTTNDWFCEAVPTRLNNPLESAIVVIMQRLHEDDISGVILSKFDIYDHLMLPMSFEPRRQCETKLGFVDPRTEDGELLFPERFPQSVVDRDSISLGPFGVAGQFQQSPIPRGGGILKAEWWATWDDDAHWPVFDFILASLDTAYTEKQENDYSAMTVWGVYQDNPKYHYVKDGEVVPGTNRTRIMLIDGWQKRLEFNALVKEAASTARRNKADRVIVEAKASGISVTQELTRLYSRENWGVQPIKVPSSLDKVARAHSVVPLFADGVIVAPDKDFADEVIRNCATFPKGKHDDMCLVAGTKIACRQGLRSIEEVKPGDQVLTPFGWRNVTAAGLTGWSKTAACGPLKGTPNHPVFVHGRGWKPLAEIRDKEKIARASIWSLIRTIRQLTLFSKELSIEEWAENGNIISARQRRMRDGVEPKGYTSQSGSLLTADSFRRAITSIIRTGILLIAALKIWTAYQRLSIIEFLRTLIARRSRLTWTHAAIWRRNGISLLKVGNGIASTLLRALKNLVILTRVGRVMIGPSLSFVPANGAGKNSSADIINEFFVHLPAKLKKHVFEEASVETQRNTTCAVYNLTVEGAHCYYANGVLVHNCDSTVQAIRYLRELGLAELGRERQAEFVESRQYRRKSKPVYVA